MARKAKEKEVGAPPPFKKQPPKVIKDSLSAMTLHKLVSGDLVKKELAYDPGSYDDRFKVARCLSTGLLSLDLHLMPNRDRTQWGFPVGRISIIAGDESSLKTTICHRLAGLALAQGGFGLWVQTEGEFDAFYAMKNWSDVGFDVDDPKLAPMTLAPARSYRDIHIAMQSFFTRLELVEKEFIAEYPNKDFRDILPPIFVIIDSIGATIATTEHDKLEDQTAKGGWDNAVRPGAAASEIHRLFKHFVVPCNRYNVAWVCTNHMRTTIGGYGNPRVMAHESAVKYYSSLTLDLKPCPKSKTEYSFLYDTVKQNSQDFTLGFPLGVKIDKIRGLHTGDGFVDIPYYYNHGFDTYASFVDGLIVAGIAKDVGKVWRFEPRQEVLDDPDFKPYLHLVSSRSNPVKFSQEEFTQLLIEDDEMSAILVGLCYKYGPMIVDDMRGHGKAKKGLTE
jgi:RecA/RadA recombinase